MALIKCPACSKEVSDQADTCPACGQPIRRGFLGRAGTERTFNVGSHRGPGHRRAGHARHVLDARALKEAPEMIAATRPPETKPRRRR
jgi:hypothetical protein